MKVISSSAFLSVFIYSSALCAVALDTNLPTADATGVVKPLAYPDDLREFRTHALVVDGVFAPDIAFTVRNCPKCGKAYVFGVYPRLSKAAWDDLSDVHRLIEESLRRRVPKTMYSARAGKSVPRACPYCGEPEHDSHVSRAYFCHYLPETGADMHIDYTVRDDKLAERAYWRILKDGTPKKVELASESVAAFHSAYGCHFSLRAVWNEIFRTHWNDDKPMYENVAPGMWFVFRPEKVDDVVFKEYVDKELIPERDKGLFTRMDTPLKLEPNADTANTYLRWADAYAEKLSKGPAECFVAMSLPELRSIAVAAAASRKAVLNLAPTKPTVAGSGFLERQPLKLTVDLRPLVKLATTNGLSLHQACSLYLGEGTYDLDNAERFAKKVQAVLPDCSFEFQEGRYMVARDADKQERKIELFQVSSKIDVSDPLLFAIYRENFLRWDAAKARFGPAPLPREVSPMGMPAFIERRIRPAEFQVQRNAPGALFEPMQDSNAKRYDLCYTSECPASLIYVDPTKERFKDIPNVNEARRFYYSEGGIWPTYIEVQDALKFPGRMVGLLECRVAILMGSEVASLASENERASALADFGEVPDDTGHVHFYAFTTNCAALAPRKLTDDEFALVKSRIADLTKESKGDAGLELNLYFDLPRAKPKGKVLRRRK